MSQSLFQSNSICWLFKQKHLDKAFQTLAQVTGILQVHISYILLNHFCVGIREGRLSCCELEAKNSQAPNVHLVSIAQIVNHLRT